MGKSSPKSIPSDTFPLATDNKMAPRPFSQACHEKERERDCCSERWLGWPHDKAAIEAVSSQTQDWTGFNPIHSSSMLADYTGKGPLSASSFELMQSAMGGKSLSSGVEHLQ